MDYFRADAGDTTFVLRCTIGAPPDIVHWGGRLPAAVTAAELEQIGTRQGALGAADVSIPTSLALEPGLGLLGPIGLGVHRAGRGFGVLLLVDASERGDSAITIHCGDQDGTLQLAYEIAIQPGTGVLTIDSTLTNTGADVIDLVDMATACLPIPPSMDNLIGFSGRWANEFQLERMGRFSGTYLRENRRGRTSHDAFPGVLLCTAATREASGEAYGMHLAWSGNHRVRVDTLADGRVLASGGALLWPGEVRLAPGEHFDSPTLVAAYSSRGFTALSQSFHQYVRAVLLRPSMRERPRPVHYNTWEAVYFDHDVERLKSVADRAAALGVERFVLDDGWFGGRRHDRAGLGDWTTATDIYPQGLGPLVDHVTGLGMEMGLWFEPEMVNPDSDLYRAHPDWVLSFAAIEQIPFRHQWVLDVARPEVAQYLIERIDALLRAHAIRYIKWDMNRDLNHPADHRGRARSHAYVLAVWGLIDRLREAHPHVEFESCSSGGGRADYGILARTDRLWTSDTNDALDRQHIQKGASLFFPLEVLGAHVGPARCHITGRQLSMAFRCGTALFGHFGLELNLAELSAADANELAAAVTLYKQHRALLHHGTFVRADTPAYLNVVGVVQNKRHEALYSVAYLTGQGPVLPDRLRLPGLDERRRYRLRLIWPTPWHGTSAPSIVETLNLSERWTVLSGVTLSLVGIQLPLAHPETVLLFHVVAEPDI